MPQLGQTPTIVQPRRQRLGDAMGVVVRQHQLRLNLSNELRRATAWCCQHRRATRHAFEYGQRQVLERARTDLQIGGLHEAAQADWIAVARQLDAVLSSVCGDESCE